MKTVKFLKPFFAKTFCLLLMLAFSCQKQIEPNESYLKIDYDDPLVKEILKLGFKAQNIVDKGAYYMVEGDIIFEKKTSKGARPTHKMTDQYGAVGFDKIGNVTITVDNASWNNAAWRQRIVDATQDAANSWSNVPSISVANRIKVTYVEGPADVIVSLNSQFPAGQYGGAPIPSGCNPGSVIFLNFQSEFMDRQRLHFLIAHELGHALGFLHTDENSGYHLVNTPVTEANSVMNSGTAWNSTADWLTVPQWPGFTFGDRAAVQTLYPEQAVSAAAKHGTTPDGKTNIKFNWTPSYICGNQVSFNCTRISNQGNIGVCNTAYQANNGYAVCPVGLTGTYKLVVYETNNPSRRLESFITIP